MTKEENITPEFYGITDYTWDKGKLNVRGDVDLSRRKLGRLPFDFGEVIGNFTCYHNELTSLEGAPSYVGRDFNCAANDLSSLEGAPKIIEGDCFCSMNKFTSLEGGPESVGGDFYCSFTHLNSLRGAPHHVGGEVFITALKNS